MKIVVYKDALLGRRGADFAVCETLRLLVRARHEIVLFLGQSESAPRCAAIPAEVKTRFLPKPKKTLLSKLGMTKPFHRFSYLLHLAISHEHPDIIVAAGTNELLDLFLNMDAIASQQSALNLRKSALPTKQQLRPLILQLHTDPRHMMKPRQKARNKKLQEAFKVPVSIQVLCEAFVPMLEELVPATKGKVVAIGNACRWLECAAVIASEAKQSTPRNPYILYPAAFTREKNQMLLIDSFAQVANDFPKWQLHLYGTGATLDACRSRVATLGLEDRILFKGFANDLRPAYADCAFVATPSVSEGFGLIVIEAAAFKKPTVALDEVPSLASLIQDNETGRLATREAFADALRDLMADDAKRRAFGDAAHIAAQAFSPMKIQQAWCDLLCRVRDANQDLAALVSNVDTLPLLGEGSRRRCFELPGGEFCVKFYHSTREYPKRILEKRPQVIREIEKYRHSRTKNTSCQEYDYWLELKNRLPSDLFAVFPERMELIHIEDRGWGLIESNLKNFDGSPLKSIQQELTALKDKALKHKIVDAFETLCERLAVHAVKFYDPPNVMVEWLADGSFRLRIADFEPANRVLIPLFTNAKFYIRLRVRRRAERFAKLLRHLAGMSLVKDEIAALGVVRDLQSVAYSHSRSIASFFYGTLIASGEPCFIKVSSEAVAQACLKYPQELEVALTDAKYACVIHMYHAAKLSDGSWAIIFNRVKGVTLQEIIDQNIEISEEDRHIISSALSEFTIALKKCSFTHCDVCLKNLIYDKESQTLTLIDFDTAIPHGPMVLNNPSVAAIRYTLLLNYGYCPAPGVWDDVYSLSVVRQKIEESINAIVNRTIEKSKNDNLIAYLQITGDAAWHRRMRREYYKLLLRPLWIYKSSVRRKKSAVLNALRQISRGIS